MARRRRRISIRPRPAFRRRGVRRNSPPTGGLGDATGRPAAARLAASRQPASSARRSVSGLLRVTAAAQRSAWTHSRSTPRRSGIGHRIWRRLGSGGLRDKLALAHAKRSERSRNRGEHFTKHSHVRIRRQLEVNSLSPAARQSPTMPRTASSSKSICAKSTALKPEIRAAPARRPSRESATNSASCSRPRSAKRVITREDRGGTIAPIDEPAVNSKMKISGRGSLAGASSSDLQIRPPEAKPTPLGSTLSIVSLRSASASRTGAPRTESAHAACGLVPPSANRSGKCERNQVGPCAQSKRISPPIPSAARAQSVETSFAASGGARWRSTFASSANGTTASTHAPIPSKEKRRSGRQSRKLDGRRRDRLSQSFGSSPSVSVASPTS